MQVICNSVNNHGDLEDCFSGMAEFLIDDIITGDLKFKSYLEAHGDID